jgi:tetratricopeptide (TPR) repeat protein
VIRLVAGLTLVAGAAQAQLAIQQPTEKVLVLPLQAAAADSAFSIATADAARTKLESLAKYKAYIVPKTKLCESLGASGFHCDELLEPDEGRALARALGIQAYTVGRLERVGGKPTAYVRIVDIGSSGFARAFTVSDPGTAQALGEQIAQRMNAVIRAGEYARDCTNYRSKGQLPRALQAANKALQQDPDLTGAHLCLMLTYEAMKMPPDSQVAVAERALRGDPQNTTALSTIAAAWLQRGDTIKAMEAREREWRANPRNKALLLGLIQLKRLRKDVPEAVRLVDVGLTEFPGDEQLGDIRTTLCIEAELPCAVDALVDQTRRDATRLRDTSFLKVAIGATQQHQRAAECREFAAAATVAAPRSTSFWKARGGCFEMATQHDSALWAYRHAADLDRSDLAGSMLVAKTIIDAAEYDTLRAKSFGSDSAGLLAHRRAFADRLDTARVYLEAALRASDTTAQLNAAALMRSGGEKLVRAGAIDRAYSWLDRTLEVLGQRRPGDAAGGLRDAIRTNASFWFGLASFPALPGMYQTVAKSKSCAQARDFNERLTRTRQALQVGRTVHEPTVQRYLETMTRFDAAMASVKAAFKCTNF